MNIRKEYNLKVHSVRRFIIAMIILVPGLSELTIEIHRSFTYEIFNILLFSIQLALAFFVAYQICLGKVRVVLTEEAIKHIWVRRFFLSFSKSFKIPWNRVDSYEFRPDRTFDSYFINLNNKKRYRLNQINLIPIKDDFKRLTQEMPMVGNKVRRIENPTSPILIENAKGLYETKGFKTVLIVMIALFVVLLIDAFNNPANVSWPLLSVIGFGLLFYLSMIKLKTRK